MQKRAVISRAFNRVTDRVTKVQQRALTSSIKFISRDNAFADAAGFSFGSNRSTKIIRER